MPKKIFSPKAYGLYLLEKMDRSEGDIKKKMREKGFAKEEIDEAILFLKDKKFIDDIRYSENFVRSCINKRYGKEKIRFKLKLHFIKDEMINSTLEKVYDQNEDQVLDLALKNWLEKNLKGEGFDYPKRNKLTRFLLNQGFGYNKIMDKLPNISEDEFIS